MHMRWVTTALVFMTGLSGCGDDTSTPADPDARDAAGTDAATDTSDTLEDAPGDIGDATDLSSPEASDAAIDTSDTPSPDTVDVTLPPDRLPGERLPRTARCDDIEPGFCLLPWPSSAFLAPSDDTPTGVALALAPDVLADDEGLALVSADGFSRITPIVLALPPGASPADYRLRLFLAEPGPDFGAELPVDVVLHGARSPRDPQALVGYPRAPLAANAEHLALLEALTDDALGAMPPTRPVELALRRGAPPTTDAEAQTLAHFAPARLLLAGTDLDPTRVARLFDFVTRSAEDPRAPVRHMAALARAAIDDGSATITLERANLGDGPKALILEGTIAGLPDPFAPAASSPPSSPATYSVPFRVVIPAGTGDYRFVMYSHGASGSVRDTAFDDLITSAGAAKVNVEIDGWTEATIPDSIGGLLVPLVGTDNIVTRMRRSLAGIAAIQRAVEGRLGDLLSAPTLLGVDNPEAGRRPRTDTPIWTGGSLGGVIGAVYGNLEPSIAGGVLNVPGAGFTHWLAQSSFTSLLDLALAARYPAMVDQQVVVALAQTLWDQVDGAAWADARETPPVFLVQMSVGDPIMPNIGTAMVARAFAAVMTLPDDQDPILGLEGLERAPEVLGRTGFTEYRTHETGASQVHGFAAGNSPAGLAARAQITAFIASLWAGAPAIRIPDECLATARPGVCDFASP